MIHAYDFDYNRFTQYSQAFIRHFISKEKATSTNNLPTYILNSNLKSQVYKGNLWHQ